MGVVFSLRAVTRVQGGGLWREAVGEVIRCQRVKHGERLADVARRAGLSPQYLSEVERGLKDPSSEMLHAITGAMGLEVPELARQAADALEQVVANSGAQLTT